MKSLKRVMAILLLAMLVMTITIYAANEVRIELSHPDKVKVNQEENVSASLIGEGAPLYTNVRMKIEVQGPAKPKLMATDSNGTTLDIMNYGYWGPEAGFAIQGDFTNTTPIKATFTEAGTYIITLTLQNVANNNQAITSKSIAIEVESEKTNIIENEVVNNEIAELPKTGTSIGEYAIYASILLIVVFYIYRVKQKNEI